MKMHPKIQQILEARGNKTPKDKNKIGVGGDLFATGAEEKKPDAPVVPDVPAKSPAKKESKKPTIVGRAPLTEELPPVEKKEDVATANTLPVANAEPPVSVNDKPTMVAGEAPPVAPEEPVVPPAEDSEPQDVAAITESLSAVFAVNKTILESLKKVREYFSFTGAKMIGVADDRFKYLEGEMQKFEKRISAIEAVLKGGQQATPPPPPPPVV